MNEQHTALAGPAEGRGNPRVGKVEAAEDAVAAGPTDSSELRTSGIHQYKILDTLGMGRHGVVKKAVHKMSGCLVALKLIPAAEGSKKGTWTEVDALKRIRHPHVVRLLDVFTTDDKDVLVLECLSGGELFDYLVSRQLGLREPEARKFTRQIMSALDHCHGLGVVHRDLKLENLLLDSDGNVKIADFGFSNIKPNNMMCSTFVGSEAYTAPEIHAFEEYSGPAADIWSLGVIIVTILTGCHPFQDPNDAVKFHKIETAEVEIPESVSTEAKDLIRTILKRKPSERPTIAQLWKHPWVSDNGKEGPLIGEVAPIDPDLHRDVCHELRKHGVAVEPLEATLAKGEVGGASVDYHLLMEKLMKDREEAARNAEIAAHASRLAGLVGPDSPFRQKKKRGKMKRLGFTPPPAPVRSTPSRCSLGEAGLAEPAKLVGGPRATSAQAPLLEEPASPPRRPSATAVAIMSRTPLSPTPASPASPEPSSLEQTVVLRPKPADGGEVPQGHRLSTDIDTGQQFLTPIRSIRPPGERRAATERRMPRRRSMVAGTTNDFVTPVRRRSSRGGLVSVTPGRDGRRHSMATRINSRGALLAMLRDGPLKETTIGFSPPQQDKADEKVAAAPAAASSPPTSPRQRRVTSLSLAERLADAASERPSRMGSAPEVDRDLPSIELSEASASFDGGDDDGGPVLDAVAEEVSPEKDSPSRLTKHRLPLPFMSGDQRTFSDGMAGEGDSLVKAEPVFRKLQSDGGHRLLRSNALATIMAAPPAAAAPDAMRGLPQSLDLAVSLPTVPFNAATTSSLPPHRIIQEAVRVLREKGIDYSVSGYKIACQCRLARTRGGGASRLRTRSTSMKEAPEMVGWEMEICMLPKLDIHGIRLHRVCGNIWAYKEKVQEVTSAMKL